MFAERVLKIVATGKVSFVTITLEAPVQENSGGSRCDYVINWPINPTRRSIYGVDGIQALNLAQNMIAFDLYTSEYHKNETLLWETPRDGYGFPLSATYRHLAEGADRDNA